MSSLELSASVVDELTHWFDEKGVVTPSINYAVFDREGVVFHHGIGEFQRDGRAPQLDTIYRICSMSKSYCIACVLVLRDQGLLSLEDPVSKFVPEFRDYVDPHGAVTVITVRMLMSNASGLPEDNAWADYHLGISREELLAMLSEGLGFSDYPDTSYQYSNIGFAVLGLIVESVTGKPFEEFANETLLDPLGLTATRYDAAYYPDNGEGGAGIAYGFESFDEGATWFHRPFVETGAFGCAGSLYSTLPDVAKWSAWLSSGFDLENTDDAILSRASRRLMQRIFTPVHSMEGRASRPELDNMGYGLGLFVEQDNRFGSFAQHSGGLPGFSTNMRWHTSSGIGIVVFTNTNNQTTATWAKDMLLIVLRSLDVPARTIPMWPETVAAAVAVDEVIHGSGHLGDLEGLYSANVLSDVPADERDFRLTAAIAKIRGLSPAPEIPSVESRLVSAISAAQVAWTVPGADGQLDCRLEMTELTPSRIQRLDITVKTTDPDALPVVTRQYLPVVL